MASTYKTKYGVDWPAEMTDEFIGMTVGKKWREFRREYGIEFPDPWVPLLDAAKALVPDEYFRVSEWTEQHFHDWVMADKGAITIGSAASGKSNDYGFLMVLDWMTDPFDTAIRLGSTDKVSLKSRSWESVLRYYTAIRRNRLGLVVPGKISKSGYAIVNDDSDDSPESVGEKAGIVGVAVNDSEDSGKLQGAHAKYVRLVIDELATITHHGNIQKAIVNLRVGADFKFFALANPASWEDPSCQYIMPPGGPSSVTPDTGTWTSTRGYIVRHHDGYKSPALKSPEAARRFPFLVTREVIEQNLADCDGNEDSPLFWQMVRGFPPPTGAGVPTVLDPKIAREQDVCGRPPARSSVIGCSAGADPAWSEGGDGAIYTVCKLRTTGADAYPVLDFTDEHRLKIYASSELPVTQQLRTQILDKMRDPGTYTASLQATAVDASANQGLADDLDIYVGQGVMKCMHVNFANRASDRPVRQGADVPANKLYGDRVTEAYCVLALFCKAGMVRGLSEKACQQLCARRFATLPNSNVPKQPLRLEPKEKYKERNHNHSPDEADAAALAALAAKEVLGILPYGWLAAASAPVVDQPDLPARSSLPESDDLSADGDGGDALDDMAVDAEAETMV